MCSSIFFKIECNWTRSLSEYISKWIRIPNPLLYMRVWLTKPTQHFSAEKEQIERKTNSAFEVN